MSEFDPISVIEAAYRLGVSDEAWMRGILREVRPAWDEGFGLGMFEVGLDRNGRPSFGASCFESPIAELFETIVMQMNRELDDQQIEHSYRKQMICGTLSERLAPVREDFRNDPVYRKHAHPHGVYDCLGVQIMDPSGTMLIMVAPLQEVTSTAASTRHRWARLAAHLAAGYRLRRQDGSGELAPDAADAVLSDSGQICHIADPRLANARASHDRLELAAEAIGRSRGDLRRDDPAEAIALWQALIDGRYSLVEHVDTDGKKTWLAQRNDPQTAEPPQLTPAERQVVQFAAMEHSDALIAYELGLSEPRVKRHLDSGLVKLGLDSRIELVKLWHRLRQQGGADARPD